MSAAAGLLQGLHVAIAMRRGPHWLLNDDDAKKYGLALANALRHVPIHMAQKYIDFTALGVAFVTYEAPRVHYDMALRQHARQQQQQRRQGPGPGGAQVFQFTPRQDAREQPGAQQQPPPVQPAAPPHGLADDMTYEPDLSA